MNLNSVMTGIARRKRNEAQAHARKCAVEQTLARLALGYRHRVTRDVARTLLLNSPWSWNGESVPVGGKSIGAGVWEMWNEERITL